MLAPFCGGILAGFAQFLFLKNKQEEQEVLERSNKIKNILYESVQN